MQKNVGKPNMCHRDPLKTTSLDFGDSLSLQGYKFDVDQNDDFRS